MSETKRLGLLIFILSFLLFSGITLWIKFAPDPKLSIIACDVGQGDATLISYKDFQILTDGGPNSSVLDCLSSHMPFWDRTIEIVVLTHPQKDHYGGLVDVFERYTVQYFFVSGLVSSNDSFQALEKVVGQGGTQVVFAHAGKHVEYGLISLDILYPFDEFFQENVQKSVQDGKNVLGAYTSKRDPNDFSVVTHFSFKNFDALLTGDIGPDVIDALVEKNVLGHVEYLKVPHHGSRNGMTERLLQATTPDFATISAGKDNSFGHPHKEILDMLSEYRINYMVTAESGDVVIETDGDTFVIKN